MMKGLLIGAFLWFNNPGVSNKAMTAEPTARLEGVSRVSEIRLTVDIENRSERPVFVPYCGQLDDRMYMCFVTTRLEVLSTDGWRQPDLSCDCGVPGGIWPAKAIEIAPGKSRTYSYMFSADIYRIKPGTKCRLRVQLWSRDHFEQNVETGTFVYTGDFEFPQ